ncbi:MAG: RelA/SpoT family protein [Candidatus Nomurabacteria bacterium]|nr:RelA/SpoT family protein [Candidatus Nomurabacteria bacterium]
MPSVKEITDLIVGGVSQQEQELIEKAYKLAEKAHEGQTRINGEPHFIHPFETAKILASLGMDIETIVSGLLHDILEDKKMTEAELKNEFGGEVLFLVKSVTGLGKLKYLGHERYVESLRKLFIAMASDLRVVVIKFADRLHYLRILQYLREDKRRRIAVESIEVYAALANRLGMGKLKGDIEDAAFPFAFPKEHTSVEEIIEVKKESYQKHLAEIKKRLEKELNENKINVSEINYRIKHKFSLWKKLLQHDMDIDKIYDVVALRIVVESIEECYRVLGIIHSIWNPLPGRIKDYISLPKPNGYQSIHTTVFTGGGGTAEIQIRTEKMHAEAAYGIAAHFAYKEQGSKKINKDKSKFKWIEELKSLNYAPNKPKVFLEHLKMDFFSNHIFVFTPEGDVVDLPENSSPIDFAYSIHSDIGNHISGAKINGKMSHIFSKLKNRDIVEIIKNKDAHPSNKWLESARTTIARKHIRSYLEKHSLLNRLRSFGRT